MVTFNIRLRRDAPGSDDWTLRIGPHTIRMKTPEVRELIATVNAQPVRTGHDARLTVRNVSFTVDSATQARIQDYFSMFRLPPA